MRGTLCPLASPGELKRFIPACGEHACAGSSIPSNVGSSPRMRGTQTFPHRHNVTLRFIPAHAGTPRRETHKMGAVRFIPAHAGNTFRPSPRMWRRTVHPRACGEHDHPLLLPAAIRGSSPRMRGTPPSAYQCIVDLRFIPAHAGNTSRSISAASPGSVHPRACGEHGTGQTALGASSGSSPRMRGTRFHHCISRSAVRFIPARAGNTPPYPTPGMVRSVHPRACGEHTLNLVRLAEHVGSSPRMRGTPRQKRGRCRLRRFIPAHAGNTQGPSNTGPRPAVHPRAMRGKRRARHRHRRDRRSIPAWRGTRTATGGDLSHGRFIPACAGNPTACCVRAGRQSVHPRTAGKRSAVRDATKSTLGPSPQCARNTP